MIEMKTGKERKKALASFVLSEMKQDKRCLKLWPETEQNYIKLLKHNLHRKTSECACVCVSEHQPSIAILAWPFGRMLNKLSSKDDRRNRF